MFLRFKKFLSYVRQSMRAEISCFCTLAKSARIRGELAVRSTIICVDDEKLVLNVLYEQLSSWFGKNYNIEKAMSGQEALEIIDSCAENNMEVSVVISDYIMPSMKGDVLLENVNKIDPRIRKVMLTGYSSIDGIISAINKAGLYRYITKPWDNKDLMLTVLEAIKSYEQEKKTAEFSKGFEQLYHKYETLSREFASNYENAIEALSCAIEARDRSSAGHSKKVAQFSGIIGAALKMSDSELHSLKHMAILHDVGKIGMKDDKIEMLETLKSTQKSSLPLIKEQIACSEDIISHMNKAEELLAGIKYQFEEFDGSGPFGLKAEDIPMAGRILHLADCFVMLTSKADKPPIGSVISILKQKKGTSFDPNLVDLFTSLQK